MFTAKHSVTTQYRLYSNGTFHASTHAGWSRNRAVFTAQYKTKIKQQSECLQQNWKTSKIILFAHFKMDEEWGHK